MNDQAGLSANAREFGGAVGSGPSYTGLRSRLPTNSNEFELPNIMSSLGPVTSGPGSSLEGAINSLDFTPFGSGHETSSFLDGNWTFWLPRTCKALRAGMQRQEYIYFPLVCSRRFPHLQREMKDIIVRYDMRDALPYPGAEDRRTMHLEEVYTLPGFNYHLYKHQEDHRRKAEAGMVESQHLLDHYPRWVFDNYAVCGVGHNEAKIGHKPSIFKTSVRAQKMTQTVTEGECRMYNIFGVNPQRKNVPVFFLLKQIEEEQIPHAYQYTMAEKEIVRDPVHHRQLLEDDIAPFRPYQLLPYVCVNGNQTPSMKERRYFNDKGEECYAHVVRFGTIYEPTKVRPTNTNTAPNCFYDTLACMSQPQVTMHIDISQLWGDGYKENHPETLTYAQSPEEQNTITVGRYQRA